MKRMVCFAFFLFAFSFIKAQAPSAVFYSELGEKFTIYIDGVAQYKYPELNVKILDISGLNHEVKIVFENKKNEEIDKSINLASGTESSFVIYKRSGHYDMSAKNQIPLSQASRSANSSEQSVITFRLSAPVTTTTTTTTQSSNYGNDSEESGNANIGINMGVSGDGGNVNVSVNIDDNTSGTKTNSNATSHSSTSSSSISSSNGGQVNNTASPSSSNNTSGSVSISANISGGNNQTAHGKPNNSSGGVKTNNNQSNNNVTTSTQTTTVGSENINGGQQTFTPIKHTTPAVAGYKGRIGCANPMNNDAFVRAKESIQAKSFANAQLTVAKQIVDANCLVVSQIIEIVKIFDFEESRLEFAKYAYKKTYDLDNYYQVNDAFDFEGSVSKLDEFIRTGK